MPLQGPRGTGGGRGSGCRRGGGCLRSGSDSGPGAHGGGAARGGGRAARGDRGPRGSGGLLGRGGGTGGCSDDLQAHQGLPSKTQNGLVLGTGQGFAMPPLPEEGEPIRAHHRGPSQI